MTGPHVNQLEAAMSDHAQAESDQVDNDRAESDQVAQDHPQVKGRAEYAIDAATYRHPEDVENGVFERQAKAQAARR